MIDGIHRKRLQFDYNILLDFKIHLKILYLIVNRYTKLFLFIIYIIITILTRIFAVYVILL